MSINQYVEQAECFVSQCRREIARHQSKQIQIRADFERGGFCLVANGEPNGMLYRQYKRAVIDRAWVLAQLEAGEA